MAQLDIFISHSTSDDAIVNQIYDALSAAGLEVWADHRNLKPGDDWNRGIEKAANDCQAAVFILSPRSARSDYCANEWQRILRLNKPLYVALVEPVMLPDYPLRLNNLQRADLHSDFTEGMTALLATIKGEVVETAPLRFPISGSYPYFMRDYPIFGREADLTAIDTAFNTHRIVTITGLGGIGKTHLAAEIARNKRFTSGTLWYRLNEEFEPQSLVAKVREHLGVDNTTSDEKTWQTLSKHALLIVLDNAESCQQPRAYADWLERLDTSGGTRLLMTSRQRWKEIKAQSTYPLAAPSPEAAIQILQAMWDAAQPDNPLAGLETELVQAARYHPRLLEYAVAWLQAYPASYVLNLLKTLQGDDPEEAMEDMLHKTVRQIESTPKGQRAIEDVRRLAVCRGGFDFEAALALGTEATSVGLLADWSLLQRGTAKGVRYEVPPLVSEVLGEDKETKAAHYDYYLNLANQHKGRQDYAGLDVESVNLEAAFYWAIKAGDAEKSLDLANSCGVFLKNRGRVEQFMTWMQEIELLLGATDEALRANWQNSLGNAYGDLAGLENRHENLGKAIGAYAAALVYWTPETAPLDYATTQTNLGAAYSDLAGLENRGENLGKAIGAYAAALVYRTPETAPLGYAGTQNNLGNAYRDLAGLENQRENLGKAIGAYRAALVYWTPETAPLGYATTQYNLGNAYGTLAELENQRENLGKAIGAYTAALVYLTPETAPLGYAGTQTNLGIAYMLQDNIPAALVAWHEAEKYYRLMGMVDNADEIKGWIEELS